MNRRYILHLCPREGHGSFDEQKISRLMDVAIENLSRENAHICCIAGRIGHYPQQTIEQFQNWQRENRV